MSKRLLSLVVYLALILAACVVALGAWNSRRYDIRAHPLAHPITAEVLDNGALRLADGRTLCIAGVLFPAAGLERDAAMKCLRIAVKQGVEIRTDLGDGSAMLVCEPRFYNWCGTGNVGGWYVQCGLGELLVAAGYAKVNPRAVLPEEAAKRLRIAEAIGKEHGTQEFPTRCSDTGIRCASGEQEVANIDELLEADAYPKKP